MTNWLNQNSPQCDERVASIFNELKDQYGLIDKERPLPLPNNHLFTFSASPKGKLFPFGAILYDPRLLDFIKDPNVIRSILLHEEAHLQFPLKSKKMQPICTIIAIGLSIGLFFLLMFIAILSYAVIVELFLVLLSILKIYTEIPNAFLVFALALSLIIFTYFWKNAWLYPYKRYKEFWHDDEYSADMHAAQQLKKINSTVDPAKVQAAIFESIEECRKHYRYDESSLEAMMYKILHPTRNERIAKLREHFPE
jgi:hypothetical protein